MNAIETYIVDAFTDKPFCGNPAGVCLVENDLGKNAMLSIAKELGLSETAFIQKQSGLHTYSIRYFSPKMEIPLCGHATMAASKVLFEKYEALTEISFINIENLKLTIEKSGDDIVMEFPIYKTTSQKAPKKLLAALGLTQISNSVYNQENKMLLLEIEDSEILKNLKPDFEKLKASHNTINGVLVSAPSAKPNYDYESRYFWPWSGTNEDPVTGATHTFLAKYWGDKLKKQKMNAYQCSERTGFMEVELIDEYKVRIKSKAQIVLKGQLKIK